MTALLQVTDLRKAYSGVHALDGVSFDVDGGSITGANAGLVMANDASFTAAQDVLLANTANSIAGRVSLAGRNLAWTADNIALGTVGGTGGVTQYDSTSIMNASSVDGSPFGSVTGVSISKDGTVTAQFSNGLSQDVYKIPVATFSNPDGLAQVSGNAYVANKSSGAANINVANSGSAGGSSGITTRRARGTTANSSRGRSSSVPRLHV